MKITKVEAFPISIPYHRPFTVSLGTAVAGNHVIVKIHTDEGIVGVGECALIILPHGGETQENITLAIRHYLGPALIGEDPFDIDRIMGKFEKITDGKHGFLFSLAGIDNALWDIMGKRTGLPVHKLLGGAGRTSFSLSKAMPIKPPKEMQEEALKLKELGYKLLTVKVGIDPKDDIVRVAAVREAVGPDFPIEVDANQGYNPDVAIQTLRKMEKYDLSACEQPCQAWDLDGMAKVAAAIDTPIIADESVATPLDVLNIIKKKAADAICIKIPKAGGIYYCKKMVAIAEAEGLPCSVGSMHPFGVGAAALHHFVAATKEIEEPIGYGTPLERYVGDIIKEPIQVVNGRVSVLQGPGLGVELDEEMMAKYANPIVVD